MYYLCIKVEVYGNVVLPMVYLVIKLMVFTIFQSSDASINIKTTSVTLNNVNSISFDSSWNIVISAISPDKIAFVDNSDRVIKIYYLGYRSSASSGSYAYKSYYIDWGSGSKLENYGTYTVTIAYI